MWKKIKEQAWDRMPVLGRWIMYPIFIFMLTMVLLSIFIL